MLACMTACLTTGLACGGTGANAIVPVATTPSVLAAQFGMPDCGANIMAADSALGNQPGTIYVDAGCGAEISTPVILGAGHVLSVAGGNVIQVRAPSPAITLSSASVVEGSGTLRVAANTNPQMLVYAPPSANGWRVSGITLDGNRAQNPGPYPAGAALLWAGNGNATGQAMSASVDHAHFQHAPLNALFINDVQQIVIADNTGSDIGGQFVHLGGSLTAPTYTQHVQITGNQSDYSTAAEVSTVNVDAAGVVTWVAGANFSSTWGSDGSYGIMSFASGIGSPGNIPIHSCLSTDTCTLDGWNHGVQTGVISGVGDEFGIGGANVSHITIADNVFSAPDGAFEAVNLTMASNSWVLDNQFSWPSPHTMGAECITMSDDPATPGSVDDFDTVEGNACTNPFSTGITFVALNPTDVFVGDVVLHNSITDANGGTTLPAPGYDNAIRLAGPGAVSGALVDCNVAVSTRTGLSPPRNGFDYAVSVEPGALNSLLGVNEFRSADSQGESGELRDNGTGTLQLYATLSFQAHCGDKDGATPASNGGKVIW